MTKLPGKLVLIDDQEYEKMLLKEALLHKKWEASIEGFTSTREALNYLRHTQDRIFLLICDMNMPEMNGLALKQVIDEDPQLSQKAIPFIFLSTSATRSQIKKAYTYRVQGYFQKPDNLEEQAHMLDTIIRYWVINQHPNIEQLPEVDGVHPS